LSVCVEGGGGGWDTFYKFKKLEIERKNNKLDHGVGGGMYVFGAFYLMPSSCMVVDC
jgi:hypothetical protein